MPTNALFQRFYFSKPWYVSGTALFHELVKSRAPKNADILEIGAGPSNKTSDYLSTLGRVTGLDIDKAVKTNHALGEAHVFDGKQFPFPDHSFAVCVSNYVLEHVPDPDLHFKEVARVLRPGGIYLFRTPNIWHYVTIASRLLPHSVHLRLANRLRGLKDAHDPYPTVYRANSQRAILRHAQNAALRVSALEMLEPEPSYGAANPILFFPMMFYERMVNRLNALKAFRVNILGILEKP
jgi:SAM-dependent methyltransferase